MPKGIAQVLVVAVLLLVPIEAVQADQADSLLLKCSAGNRTHSEETNCLKALNRESENDLIKAEQTLANHLSQIQQDADEIASMQKALRTANKAFPSYREQQCELFRSLAAGGNGAHDIVLACAIQLNEERKDQLLDAIKIRD